MYVEGCKPEFSVGTVDYIFFLFAFLLFLCLLFSEDVLYLIFIGLISQWILKVLKMFLDLEQYVVNLYF